MAESLLTLDEGPQSPDIFSDHDQTLDSIPSPNYDEAFDVDQNEPELSDNTPEWKGISMDEIHKGLGPFGLQQHPPIVPSNTHAVLFRLPLDNRGPPKPYPTNPIDKWSVNYVRMPNSKHSLYPIEHENKPREFRLRWEVIQEALLQNFVSVSQLETAIFSYNDKYALRWDFKALHNFFFDVMEEGETEIFFQHLLPKIIQLALQLPRLITGPIPLLKCHINASISLSQLQVASLIANAFFCTFPRRNSTNPQSEYSHYPSINFNRLFSCFNEERPDRSSAVVEKLKAICHYFRRVTASTPEGTITIQRRYIPKENCPRWDKLTDQLSQLHITSKGTIEAEGAGLLQVDFANKYLGGGVLGWGCVQEEIRFVICPELMVTMLVTEALDDTEALIITGVEQYSKYKGYSSTFKWAGDFIDETPRDNCGRRRTSVLAIDALCFSQAEAQFKSRNIIRELNKAYVGFSSSEMHHDDLSAIATGNWGCGAFRGNPQLKVLIQLMAAAVAKRPMVYFTFGDKKLRDSVAEMYWHLVDRNIEIGNLFCLLRQYEDESSTTNHLDFYRFLFNRSKIKPLTKYFNILQKPKSPEIYEVPIETKNLKEINNLKKPTVKNTSEVIVLKEVDNLKKPIDKNTSEVLEIKNFDEEENSKVRDLIDNYCHEFDAVFDKDKKQNDKLITPVVKKKERSLWNVIAENESVEDRVDNKPTNQRYSSLNLFVKKSPSTITSPENKQINFEKPSSHKKKNPFKKNSIVQKSPAVYKKGQTKIIDFFTLKNVNN
ncbi:hypothetical protein HCN44_010786 [Aphidius gifuensis]|uniref:poly(ADP-ribose) glycohydrolase n=1 Tax=Aphidius gifuensis TaxID=684658 RepID=A0A835CT62_APHGI|nr:poly(ADP-ribose) glycohydrolase-like [Aphidius gifuensis]KAF7991985.1 hypothetical protein HCN44_010786 [Aphidius gifuensis]